MAVETSGESGDPGPETTLRKRKNGPKLRRSAAWSLAVARMTEATKLPDGEKG